MPETGAKFRPKATEVIAEADVHQQFDRLVEVADRWLEGLALTFTGLTIHLAAGKLYVNGYLVTFGSTVNEALGGGDGTYYVYGEYDADITVNMTGIAPADSIKLWEADVAGGVITATRDFRDRTLYLDPPLVTQGGLDADGNEVTGVGTPTANDSAANKQYVDSAVNAVGGIKRSVRVASTGNVNVAAPGTAVFDGITLANGEEILLKDQSTASQNGPYTFNGSGSAMTRRSDFDTSAEVNPGVKIAVSEGTVNAGTTWRLATVAPITLGATSLSFVLDSVQGQRGTTNGLATLTSGVHTPAERPAASTSVKGDVTLATATPAAVAAAGSAGTANGTVANADHAHAHGNQAGGSLHAVATGSVAGFMSAADKTTFDAATAAATADTLAKRNGAGQAAFAEATNDDHAVNLLQVQSLAYNMALLNGGM